MKAFATLLDRLVLTPSRNGKLKLLTDYFRDTPDPDRGYGLAAIAGTLDLKSVKPALLRELVATAQKIKKDKSIRCVILTGEAQVFSAGIDLADLNNPKNRAYAAWELIRPGQSRTEVRGAVRDLLDRLDTSSRFAFLKLATGSLRIGVSARLARQALADFAGKDIIEIETLWHGLAPPYTPLFAWLEGKADRPVLATPAIFHSVMLATPVADGDLDGLDPADYAAEWKWDGIRVQLSRAGGTRKLYSRSGDDISGAFPDVLDAIDFEGVMDGELLIGGTARSNNLTRTFSDLQQRLNRKTVTAKMLDDYPAFIRAYDLLFDGESDIRAQTYLQRRGRLSDIIEHAPHDRFDLSPLIGFSSWQELDTLRAAPPDPVIEGVMIKRRDSTYQAGRAKGPWFKWKRDPYNIDAVMMYAQRGHGKRSSYYSDFTFGVWAEGEDGEQLVPVGKAYFGFTDAELEVLDKFVRDNTVERFGPVRAVRATPDFGFVLEVAFEGINRSTRHKSGVAMRFPRIARLRADKLPAEADRLSTLVAMIDGVEG